MRAERKNIESFEREREKLLKEIAELSKSEELYKKFERRQKLLTSMEQTEAEVLRLESRAEELKKESGGAEEYRAKYEFIQNLIQYLETRKNMAREDIRKTFNAEVNELYKKLGFTDFENIQITPGFPNNGD